MATTKPRSARSLPDMLVSIVHLACDERQFELASQLLHLIEKIVRRDPVKHHIEVLVAAHERLWLLRHSDRSTGPL